MSDEKKGLKGFPSFEKNPTSEPQQIKELAIGYVDEWMKVMEIQNDVLVGENMERGKQVSVIDRLSFIKLFPDAQTDIMRLSSSGISVLSYIFNNLPKLKDEVVIEPKAFDVFYQKVFQGKDSRMVCYRGIVNLLQFKFIYRKIGESVYFIDVNKFYNGNRTKIEWVATIQNKLKSKEFVSPKEVAFNGIVAKEKKKIDKQALIRTQRKMDEGNG